MSRVAAVGTVRCMEYYNGHLLFTGVVNKYVLITLLTPTGLLSLAVGTRVPRALGWRPMPLWYHGDLYTLVHDTIPQHKAYLHVWYLTGVTLPPHSYIIGFYYVSSGVNCCWQCFDMNFDSAVLTRCPQKMGIKFSWFFLFLSDVDIEVICGFVTLDKPVGKLSKIKHAGRYMFNQILCYVGWNINWRLLILILINAKTYEWQLKLNIIRNLVWIL